MGIAAHELPRVPVIGTGTRGGREMRTVFRDNVTHDLATALRIDDENEDLGMCPDDRRTCYTCKSWADHWHNWDGERMPAHPDQSAGYLASDLEF